jgi:hypothetical protein
MTSLVNMLRDNGTWEADAAAAKIARLEAALEETGNALLSQIETSSELADRAVYFEKVLTIIANLTEHWTDSLVSQINEIAREGLKGGPGETPAS